MPKIWLREHFWPYVPGTIVEVDDERATDLVARRVATLYEGDEPAVNAVEPDAENDLEVEGSGEPNDEQEEEPEDDEFAEFTVVDLRAQAHDLGISPLPRTRQGLIDAIRIAAKPAK